MEPAGAEVGQVINVWLIRPLRSEQDVDIQAIPLLNTFKVINRCSSITLQQLRARNDAGHVP